MFAMSIAFHLPTTGIAGGLFIVYRQAQYLATSGYRVSLVYDSYDTSYENIINIHPSIVVYKGIDELPPNHCFDLAIATWWKTAFSVFRIKSSKYAYFVQSDERRFYDDEVNPIDRANRHAVELTYKHFPGLMITEARWIADMLRAEFRRNVSIAPNGVDLQLFNPNVCRLQEPSDKIRFLVEGPSNVPFKRVEYTHNCLSRFYADVEVWHIANDGCFRPYWHADRVFSCVPYTNMPSLMASCDLIVKLSTVEGFFGPPLEMMACGGTALTSNVSGHNELLINDVNGYVVEMDNLSQTIDVLDMIINKGRDGLADLKKQALETASKFSWDVQHPLFASAVESALVEPEAGDSRLLKVLGELYLRDPLFFLSVYKE